MPVYAYRRNLSKECGIVTARVRNDRTFVGARSLVLLLSNFIREQQSFMEQHISLQCNNKKTKAERTLTKRVRSFLLKIHTSQQLRKNSKQKPGTWERVQNKSVVREKASRSWRSRFPQMQVSAHASRKCPIKKWVVDPECVTRRYRLALLPSRPAGAQMTIN